MTKGHQSSKIFCIGRNKTGTTSLRRAFEELGYIVGDQATAEVLTLNHYFKGDFQPIIEYCRTAEVFQDIPFSYPETYKHLDRAYPGSKFILTIRTDADEWYRSVTRFHAKVFGKNGNLPRPCDMVNAFHIWEHFFEMHTQLYQTSLDAPYDPLKMKQHYNDHNTAVIDFFKKRPSDLLIINLAEFGSYQRFLEFIGRESPRKEFPWENRT